MSARMARHISHTLVVLLACAGTSCFPMMDDLGDRRGGHGIRKPSDERMSDERPSKKVHVGSERDDSERKVPEEKSQDMKGQVKKCGCPCRAEERCSHCSRCLLGADGSDADIFYAVADLVLGGRKEEILKLTHYFSAEFGAGILAFAAGLLDRNGLDMIRFLLSLRRGGPDYRRDFRPIIDPNAVYIDVQGRYSVILLVLKCRNQRSLKGMLDAFFNAGFRIEQPVIGSQVEDDTILHVLVRHGDALLLAEILMDARTNPARIDGFARALRIVNRHGETPLRIAETARNDVIVRIIRSFLDEAERFLAQQRQSAVPAVVAAVAPVMRPPLRMLTAATHGCMSLASHS